MSCGAAHTLALSTDGRTVWSFGSGDQGKLGHGDTARQHRPKVIDALQGVYVRKVAAGSQFSLALTSNGQVRIDQPRGSQSFCDTLGLQLIFGGAPLRVYNNECKPNFTVTYY